MRRALASLVALLATLVLAPTALATPRPVGHVVGGGYVFDTTSVPWQVLVEPGPYVCGGSILDATHVVTAAHCVYDEDAGRILTPAEVEVHAGITDIGAPGQHPTVIGVTIDPAYNPYWATGDAAVLTLADPGFALDGTHVAAIPLAATGLALAPSDSLRLSGWGSTQARAPEDENVGPVSQTLKVADGVHPSSLCDQVYEGFDDDQLLCAGQAGLDACQGDSGGPLAHQVSPTTWELVGVVSGGAGCGWAGYPGYYARTSSAANHAFLAARGNGYAVSAPANLAPPTVTGTPAPGGVLDCDIGRWNDATLSFGLRYLVDGQPVEPTESLTLPITTAMAGQSVVCDVMGYGLVGEAEATSAPVTIAGGTDPLPPPPVTPVAPPSTPTPTPGADTKAPKAKVVRSACTRKVCRLDVTATDPQPSSGIKSITGTVVTTYKTTCGRHHRRCTRTVRQKLKATFVGPGAFRLTTPKMHKGKHVFSLVATDLAGHRQAKPTTMTRTTR
jgi:secreted trypsin-like serine protease